ncbi:MAG: FAD-linked oxidoreductase [Nevskia sp.]|nr:FAD-linked oxidoreductase [Nevskia sp.]
MSSNTLVETPAGSVNQRGWSNWSGAVQFTPKQYTRPDSLAALQAVVRNTAAAGRRLRVSGSGHSFVPLVATDDQLLSLDQLSGIESCADGQATIWAGTQLRPLGGMLEQRGYSMLNLGDINVQALAGAVATGTHGTGAALGSISSQVLGLTLVLPGGETVECSATQEPELFAAARVALGSLGVMAKITVKLEKAYRLKLSKQAMDLDECLARAPQFAADYRHFEFYWCPHTRRTLVKLMNPTEEPESNRGLTTFTELVLENGALDLLSRISRANPNWAPAMSKVIAWSAGADESHMVASSHRAFSTLRMVRFNEMEYELPAPDGADALRELAEFVDKKRILVHFPVEYRYVAADDIWLSPFYRRDAVAISVHQYKGMDYAPYFRGAEAIFRNHGGRPHWGKMHTLTAKELAPLYPQWDAFHALRRRIDPQGVFVNPYLRTLFGD